MKLCLNMIVKDESHVIQETLTNVYPYIKYWVISDTGSTDGTQELIRNFFKEKRIPGVLVDHKWEDFGTNRTLAFQEAYKHRKKFDYIWVIDADDLVVGQLPQISDKQIDMYSLTYGSGFTYDRSQIFRSTLKWEYVGVLHEYPRCVSKKNPTKERLSGDYYIDSRRLGARNKHEDKYLRDVKLLHKGLEKEPDNVRYIFYLAQSYMDAKDFENSIKWYQKRVDAVGWFEEVFYSLYRIATNKEHLSRPWLEVEKDYMRAWAYLRQRAEPLYAIGKHYISEKNWTKAYNILNVASQISFPSHLELFLFRSVYDFEILENLSLCAYNLANYRESFDICQKLLTEKGINQGWRLPPDSRLRIEEARAACIAEILPETETYPVKEITKMRAIASNPQKNIESKIVLTMTTCKRFDLFSKTVNSFLQCCQDSDRIDKWICVDDNSSEEDRAKMKKLYPFFDFIWKSPEEKGHLESMNILHELIKKYDYNVHIEDDWHFFETRNYITDALTIFQEEPELGQVLFNRNYGERDKCIQIAGGIPKTSLEGFRYLVHEHYQKDTPEWKAFQIKNHGKPNCCYWPHYSLRPSILKVDCLKQVGPYQNLTGHFEMDYAKKYFEMGYRSGFFDTISCWHTGKCTWENTENSYSLNGVKQFGNLVENIVEDGDWIIATGLDSYGNDIESVGPKSIEFLKLAAEADPNCIGFNTLGFLKNKIEDKSKWISVNYSNFQMYVNKKRWNNKCE